MKPLERLAKTLTLHKQSLTTPRKIVFMALLSQEPLSIHELIERCEPVDRASVYRTVSLFEKLGIVTRLQTGWKYKLELSGDFHDHHHHATCNHCGKSIVLDEDDALEAIVYTLAAGQGFKLQNHVLELQGICEECQKTA